MNSKLPEHSRLSGVFIVIIGFLIAIYPFFTKAQLPIHSFNSSNSSNPYNLTDLDNFPFDDYSYTKLGNLMSESDSGALSFTRLTAPPYNSLNTDLFLNNGNSSLNLLNFPDSTSWDANDDTVRLFPDSTPPVLIDYNLFRKFHFSDSLTDVSTAQELANSTGKLIIVIHGWNPNSDADQFSNSPEFISLIQALKVRLQASDWQLSLYHWETDSDTGPVASATVVRNSTAAAMDGHQHGQHLGELLAKKCPNLKEVQFISHSAGAWVARGAARYLLANTGAKVQVTLLDPFIPGELAGNNTALTKSVISAMPSMTATSSGQLVLLENYYAVDIADLDGLEDATSAVFDWNSTIGVQQRIDWGFSGNPLVSLWYDSHAGPIQFYADTINSADTYLSSGGLENGDFDLNTIGWKRSLFYQEQKIRPLITSISPAALPTSGVSQLISITGSNFLPSGDPNASMLVFYDPSNNSYTRTPNNVTATTMQYDITVGSATGTWHVKVVNGNAESPLYTFTVTSVSPQLLGVSISGPANILQNTVGNQYTARAIMSDGSTPVVTANWTLNAGAPASISSSGQLSVNTVSSKTTVTITAQYTFGGTTKSGQYNAVISPSDSCGSTVTDFITNGNLESGSTGWTLSGGAVISTFGSLYHSATHYLWLGGDNGTDTAYIQTTIPSSATIASLTLYWNINSSEPAAFGAYDTFSIVVRDTSGNLLGTITNWSNLNGMAAGSYQFQSFNVLAYSGKTIRIYFVSNCHLSGSQTSNFRIDDVDLIAAVPNPVVPVLFGVGGPSSVAENTTAQYNAIVVNCDNSIQSVTPSWSVSSGPATISASGLLSPNNVTADTAATVTGIYNGNTRIDYPIKIVYVAPVYTSLAVSGASSAYNNQSVQFSAQEIFSDGSSQLVTPNWSVDSPAVNISGSGLLTPSSISGTTVVNVSASYSAGGTTHTASQQVTIMLIAQPPNFTLLSIKGPSLINEHGTSQCVATAFFSDGSSQVVNPTWNVNPPIATVSAAGLLSAGEAMTNTPVSLSATYTASGITLITSNALTVVHIDPPPKISVTVSNNQAILAWPSNFTGFSLEYATNLLSTSWQSNTVPPVLQGDEFMVTNQISPGNMFFRLRK